VGSPDAAAVAPNSGGEEGVHVAAVGRKRGKEGRSAPARRWRSAHAGGATETKRREKAEWIMRGGGERVYEWRQGGGERVKRGASGAGRTPCMYHYRLFGEVV
jgi:hypothetical protein